MVKIVCPVCQRNKPAKKRLENLKISTCVCFLASFLYAIIGFYVFMRGNFIAILLMVVAILSFIIGALFWLEYREKRKVKEEILDELVLENSGLGDDDRIG